MERLKAGISFKGGSGGKGNGGERNSLPAKIKSGVLSGVCFRIPSSHNLY